MEEGDDWRPRWQWPLLGLSALLVVLRVVLDGERLPRDVLVVVALVFGLVVLFLGAGRSWTRMSELRDVRSTWKPLSRADRRAVRQAVRERRTVRHDLVEPAVTFARLRSSNGHQLAWLGAALASIQVPSALYPWSIVLAVIILLIGATAARLGARWRGDYTAVLAQRGPASV